MKNTNIHIMGVPKGEMRKKGAERVFEKFMDENF